MQGTFANPVPLGLLIFGVTCFLTGLFFMGIDAEPPEKVGISLAIFQMFAGVTILIICTSIILFGSPVANPTFSMWVSTIFGYFGFLWIVLAYHGFKGADLKPFSTFLLVTAVICAIWAYMSLKLGIADFVFLFVLVVIACVLGFLGIRGMPAQAAKIAGFFFAIIGLDGIYLALKNSWAVLPK